MADISIKAAYGSVVEDEGQLFVGFAEGEDEEEGYVLFRQPVGGGLIFVCFAILLGAFTLKTAAPEVSFVGKMAGALFVWAMAVFDAYKVARVRQAVWSHAQRQT